MSEEKLTQKEYLKMLASKTEPIMEITQILWGGFETKEEHDAYMKSEEYIAKKAKDDAIREAAMKNMTFIVMKWADV